MPVQASAIRQVLDYLDNSQGDIIDFAIQLVETPTPNPPGNELAAAQLAAQRLHSLGLINTSLYEASPGRANLVCSFDTGKPGRTLLLNGHLDTKPALPLDAWETDPYKGVVRDGKLFGLGSADMKGPDAALAYALAAVANEASESLSGQVKLVYTADEEGTAIEGARYLVSEVGITADAVLIAEPCGIDRNWDSIPLIGRGVTVFRINIRGTQTHSSISDRIPIVNASLEASQLLLFLRDHLHLTYPPTPLCPQGPTINLGATVRAGQAYAMVAGDAEIVSDIRTIPGMSQAQLRADIEHALDQYCRQHKGIDISWDFFSGTLGWTEPSFVPPDFPLVKAVADAADAILGEPPPFGYFPGGTEAIYWQGVAGIPTIPGFGPGLLSNCHKPNEFIETAEIIRAAKIYALTILNYLNGA